MTNQEEKEMQLTVPYIMHEAAQARSERTIKRLTIGIIVVSILSIIIAFLTGYFIDKGWRDYFSECEVENYSLSTDGGGNANYIGQDGDIYNGESESKKNNT